MKLFIVLILILTSTIAIAQKFIKTDSTTFKKSNVILLYSELPDEELYKMTGKVLIQEGFSLARSDKDFLTIKTETQSIDGYSFKMFISVSINNKTIIIKRKLIQFRI